MMKIKIQNERRIGYKGQEKGIYENEKNIKLGMKYIEMEKKIGGGRK